MFLGSEMYSTYGNRLAIFSLDSFRSNLCTDYHGLDSTNTILEREVFYYFVQDVNNAQDAYVSDAHFNEARAYDDLTSEATDNHA
jgi:hypothetical protein